MSSPFTIEKGVPLPVVTDSFYVPVRGSKYAKEKVRIQILLAANGPHEPKRFTTQIQNGGVRVWRIK